MGTDKKAPAPRRPDVKKITRVEELLPKARIMVNRKAADMYEGLQVKKGQKVLIINDPSADQLVVEALATAIRENKAHLTIILLEGFPGLKDPVDLLDNMFSNNWYPDWVWNAANEADIVLLTAFLKLAHTPIPPLSRKPIVDNVEMTADQMISEYEEFPVELRDIIGAVTWEKLALCSKLHWTDLEGTDLTLKVKPEAWQEMIDDNMKKRGIAFKPGHLQIPAPCVDMNGQYVSSSITFGGPVPPTTLIIEGGKAVEVKGGGKYGDRLRESFAKHKNLSSPDCPGPGVNWVTTIGLCTHPKASRSPFFDDLAGSARIYAWTYGHRRSGVIHTSVGEGLASSKHKIIRHMDTCFNTIATDKGIIIENGRLTSLEDPRVRRVAEKFGNPDELLKESWIPAIAGVNAP
ncbi:MAG: hypothetical protein Q8P24_18960 [Desulfobacterales bacterium]|nr:hypothetical protein [Desulfobacterales bacterium]